MSVTYDPKVIQQFADKLYSQARTTVALFAITGLAIGGVTGMAGAFPRESMSPGWLVFPLLGLAFGYWVGQSRAFALRLSAQTALCQVQIETNTRSAGGVTRAA